MLMLILVYISENGYNLESFFNKNDLSRFVAEVGLKSGDFDIIEGCIL